MLSVCDTHVHVMHILACTFGTCFMDSMKFGVCV